MALLPIMSRGGVVAHALVDDEDFGRLSAGTWHLQSSGYVNGRLGGERVLLHRAVMGCRKGDGLQVDHIHHDPLDNRKASLRVLSRAANSANRAGGQSNGKSVHRGVSPVAGGRWRATVVINRQQYRMGVFACELEAARAASDFRRLHMPTSERDRVAA